MAKVLGFTINIQGTEAAIENATDLRLAIQEINKQLKDPALTKPQYDKLEKQLIDLKARQQEVNAQLREQITQRRAELKVTEDSAGAYRKLSAQLTATRAKYKDLAAAGKENTEEARQLQAQVVALDKRLKDIDGSVGQFQRNVGDYTNAIKNAIPGLGAFSDGIENIGKATGRVGKAIATSFFIFELINQLAQGVQAISEFSEEFRKLQGQIQNTTQQTGEALAQTTATVKAIADTYQEDAQQIAVAANTLSKEFNVSLGTALDRVEAGFRKGANAQGDFLDQLREYPTQFREAGFSLDQFIALSIQASQEGIYSDKGLDAVKEFGLRIREQTTATKDALIGAFGPEFTRELFTGINNGSITTVQALARVSTGLRDIDLSAEQTQRVITDVFGGPGEDAGLRYLQLLADIDSETQNVTESTNEYQSQQEILFESNKALAEAQAEIANQLSNTGTEFTVLKNNVQTFLLQIAADLLRFFDELPATIAGVNAALRQFGENLKVGFGLFGETGSVADAYKSAYLEGLDKIEKDNEIAKAAQEAAKAVSENARKEISRRRPISSELKKDAERAQREVEREAAKIERERVRALEREQAETARQLSAITNLRNETLRVALGAGQELIQATITQTSDGFRLLGATLDERSTEILTRIKQRTAAAGREGGNDNLQLFFGTDDPNELAAQAESFLSGSILPVITTFQQRAADRATAALDTQIEAQEASIQRLEEQAAQTSGIQKEILKNRIAQEKATLQAQAQERERIQTEQAKKEKRLSIVQSIIQTALSVVRALANPPGPPFSIPQAVAAGIAGAAQTAIIAAQPLATGGLITGRRVTDRQNIPRQGNGDNVLATVRRGEVVLNSRQQAALGGAATFRAIGVPGFAAGGVISPPISAPTLPVAQASRNPELLQILKQLDAKTDAINRRVDRLRAIVVSEDVAEDLQDGNTIRLQATFE